MENGRQVREILISLEKGDFVHSKCRILATFSSLLISLALVGVASQAFPQPQQKMDRLLVYGDGFMFGVKEPEGWLGDTERASSFQMNILIYPRQHRPPEQVPDLDGVIRLRVNKKVDENTEQDLAADMAGYKKRFPKVQFTDIEVSHPAFKCYSKLFSVDGQFHEYVIYVNPGEQYWYMFSVAYASGKKPASDTDLNTLRMVIASLVALGGKAQASQEATDFETALKAADDNVKSKSGKKYDTAFARKAAPWLSSALARCTRGLPDAELGPFTVLARVAESGLVEEVLIKPQTKVAECLKPDFAAHKGPKPPGPSWWVKVDIAIR
jgi:hypothetical protein